MSTLLAAEIAVKLGGWRVEVVGTTLGMAHSTRPMCHRLGHHDIPERLRDI